MKRYVEIDGEKIEVHGCDDCPCHDDGDMGYGAMCKHPKNSYIEVFDGKMYERPVYLRVGLGRSCPLREEEEE